ncbi:hypothetical protein PIB30_098124 [Stylosanthes scabra]|uniref:Uncharacterized protein n=1 Tax=Stylosanthes scabra TaxID=79078 RepID=A0ABU6UWQ4_9FABA|nr:hypothetical protein [Stylosanthes scabra]
MKITAQPPRFSPTPTPINHAQPPRFSLSLLPLSFCRRRPHRYVSLLPSLSPFRVADPSEGIIDNSTNQDVDAGENLPPSGNLPASNDMLNAAAPNPPSGLFFSRWWTLK